jgi:hypothetical protein
MPTTKYKAQPTALAEYTNPIILFTPFLIKIFYKLTYLFSNTIKFHYYVNHRHLLSHMMLSVQSSQQGQ